MESSQLLARDLTLEPTSTSRVPGDLDDRMLAGFLLELFLVETIRDEHRRLLDALAPEHSLTFLVREGSWLHPDDLPLFDFSTLDSLVEQFGSAVMTHQYTPDGPDTAVYSVRTAVLNPDDRTPVVFGLLGPRTFRRPSPISEYFETLVRRLQTIWADLRPLAARLREGLAQPEPTLVLNRKTGTILAANTSLSRELGLATEQLVGINYEDLGTDGDQKLAAAHLEHDLLPVTLVTLERIPSVPQSTETAGPTEVGTAEDAMKQLAAAVADLVRLTRDSDDAVVRGIIHTIHCQTEVLRGRMQAVTTLSAGVESTHGIANGPTD